LEVSTKKGSIEERDSRSDFLTCRRLKHSKSILKYAGISD
jgi:hypothetical protein